MQLAYSLQTLANGSLVMSGALLGTDFAAWNGNGWLAIGVPAS